MIAKTPLEKPLITCDIGSLLQSLATIQSSPFDYVQLCPFEAVVLLPI
jgi:hypothetical protein